MALIPSCDVYPGRTKGVGSYRVQITRVEADKPIATVVEKTLFLCPAALKRLVGFTERGINQPKYE